MAGNKQSCYFSLGGEGNPGDSVNNKSFTILDCIAVEPEEAVVMFGGIEVRIKEHNTQGIGDGSIPQLIGMSRVDEVFTAESDEAVQMARNLFRTMGLLVGMPRAA